MGFLKEIFSGISEDGLRADLLIDDSSNEDISSIREDSLDNISNAFNQEQQRDEHGRSYDISDIESTFNHLEGYLEDYPTIYYPELLEFSSFINNTFNPEQQRDEHGRWISTGGQATPALHASFSRAFKASKGAKSNLVSLASIKEHSEFKDLSIKDFHTAIQSLRRAGSDGSTSMVTLAALEGRHGSTQAERDASVREDGNRLGYVSVRPEHENKVTQLSETQAPSNQLSPSRVSGSSATPATPATKEAVAATPGKGSNPTTQPSSKAMSTPSSSAPSTSPPASPADKAVSERRDKSEDTSKVKATKVKADKSKSPEDHILEHLTTTGKGIGAMQLKARLGLKDKEVKAALESLEAQGKIKALGTGVKLYYAQPG